MLDFSQSRLSNQFLTWEDGGELLFLILGFVYDLWVWRGIGIVDAFIIPSTCIRGRDIVVTLLVRVSVCVSVCVSPLNS